MTVQSLASCQEIIVAWNSEMTVIEKGSVTKKYSSLQILLYSIELSMVIISISACYDLLARKIFRLSNHVRQSPHV